MQNLKGIWALKKADLDLAVYFENLLGAWVLKMGFQISKLFETFYPSHGKISSAVIF